MDNQEIYQQTQQALEDGDPQTAFQTLRPLLADAEQMQEATVWNEAWSLFAHIAEAIAGSDFAAHVNDIVEAPDDVNALYELGYELIEQGLHDLAVTVLSRANNFAPGQEGIVTELVVALEQSGLHGQACQVLRAAPALLESSFLCHYLLAFNGVMSGDLEGPRRLLPGLQDRQDEMEVTLTERIENMLGRADAIRDVTPLDEQDLRGWHFVVTGGVLLHLSPYGFDEGMNGRYAFYQDSPAHCREGIERLSAVLHAWQIDVPRVFALPDRNSAILAEATAQAIGCPLELWPLEGTSLPGLIVAYDLNEADPDLLSMLYEHRPGQILWSHAACWTTELPLAADITTFLYQVNLSPWAEGRLRVDPDTNEVQSALAAEGAIEELANEILRAELETEALTDMPALLALVNAMPSLPEGYTAGALRQSGQRQRQWVGSPVASSRFL